MRNHHIMRGQLRLQILVTQRCNAVCLHCDKAVGYAKLPDIEMTAELMREFVDEAIAEGITFDRVSLSGGEPIVNKELQGIINEVARIPGMTWCRVLTNVLDSTKKKRLGIKFPDRRFKWTESPIDDTANPKSGKNMPGVRYRDRVHHPFWISPADLGIEATYHNCNIRNVCGRGLDNSGYSICGQAPILGRILGIDPYVRKTGVGIKKRLDFTRGLFK